MVVCRGDGFMHFLGHKKDANAKNTFQIEISDVNEQNRYGESLIFVATFFCEIDIVYQLLILGADPNIQNVDGNSSLHAACFIGNVKLLHRLVESGGDLRLINNDGERPCQLFRDVKSHEKLKLFEQLTFSEFFKHFREKSERIFIPQRKYSILENLTKINKNGNNNNNNNGHFGFKSGFGNYFSENKTLKGLISSIKIILNSKNLVFDTDTKFTDFTCGYSMKMFSKLWNNYPVSVKTVDSTENKMFDIKHIDLTNQTIKEANILGSLRHPNILLLMAVNLLTDEACCSVFYELIFERCYKGSLFDFIHVERKEFSFSNIMLLLNQIIEGLLFCHEQQIIHCSFSSNAVYMLNSETCKLGNFENAVIQRNQQNKNKSKKSSSYNFLSHSEGILYKWLAPEILYDSGIIGTAVDIYGVAVVTWEMFTGEIPHSKRSYKSVLHHYMAPFNNLYEYRIPDKLLHVLKQSFSINSSQRPLLSKIRTLLEELNFDIIGKDFIDKETNKKNDDHKSITQQTNLSNLSSIICSPKTDETITAASPNKKTLNRKSNSLNCLSKLKKDFSSFSTAASYNRTANKHWYRNIAALPTHGDGDPFLEYPSTLTKVTIEGRGNLSNETHRKSIIRGMKPASHQTGLSTSQTNICKLIGTEDLIKTSSKSSLSKFDSNETSFSEERKICVYNKVGYKLFTHRKKLSPLNSKIANLIEKYESSDSHPYSSSNCSTPKAFGSPQQLIISENEENTQFSSVSALITANKSRKFFSSLVSGEKQQQQQGQEGWSSTTDEENVIPKNICKSKLKHNGNFLKVNIFGDSTNKYK